MKPMIGQNKNKENTAEPNPKKPIYDQINWEWIEHIRTLSVPEKNRIAFEMAEFALTQKRLILADQNPDWTEEQVDYEAKRQVFGVSKEDFQ